MKDTLKVLGMLFLLVALITGWGWCEWAGYKDRYPHGGCLGFFTSCKGGGGKR
jgi:hypothetical protein